jgi:hypothetical protein
MHITPGVVLRLVVLIRIILPLPFSCRRVPTATLCVDADEVHWQGRHVQRLPAGSPVGDGLVEDLVTVIMLPPGTEPRVLSFPFIWVLDKTVLQPVLEPAELAWWQTPPIPLLARTSLWRLCTVRPLTGRPLTKLLTA